MWVDALVSAACELPPLNMSAACLALLSALCLFCTTQTVEGNGLIWRPVGGSASIQCKLSEPLPITLVTLSKGLEKNFPVVSKTSQRTTIAQNFRGRLRAEGDLLNVDVLIWNLTSEDTGLYWCGHEWFDNGLSEHKKVFDHVPAVLVIRDEQQCDNGNQNLLVGLVVLSAAVLFGVFIAFLLWSIPKIKKWHAKYRPRHTTNDVYEDMRGTLRAERRPV